MCLLDMVASGFLCVGLIAPFYCAHDTKVLRIGLAMSGRHERREVLQQRHRIVQDFQRFQQILVVRGFIDVLVKQPIECDQGQWIAAFVAELPLQLVEDCDLAIGCVLGGKAGSGTLQDFAHRIEIKDLFVRQHCDGKPASGAYHKQPPLLQSLQRFSYRRAADAKGLGDIFLAYALSSRKMPFPDGIAQTPIDKIRSRPILNRTVLQRGQKG